MENTLLIAAAIQEMKPADGVPAISLPTFPLSSDWTGVTGWLAVQTVPQRLSTRALEELFATSHAQETQQHLVDHRCVSLLSVMVRSDAGELPPIGLLKAENHR